MKRALSISLTLGAWVLLIAYIVAASRYCSEQKNRQQCKGINVRIMDSTEHNFITPSMVKNWLVNENMKITGEELADINTLNVESVVKRRGFVKTSRVYATLDGYLNIDITQRKPIMRVNSSNGYNFYVTEDNYILPLQRYFVTYVPVVTGHIDAPFPRDFVGSFDALGEGDKKKVDKSYIFLHKLINFVKFVNGDDFWSAFIVQINVTGGDTDAGDEPQVEIVPRAGDFVVQMGSVDNYRDKLAKLMSFYNNGLAYDGWGSYSYINLKYKNQIVCIK